MNRAVVINRTFAARAVLLALLAAASPAARGAEAPAAAPAAIVAFGLIERDTVWSGTVSILGKVQVRSGATLTIQPGTQVRFAVPPARPDAGEERVFVQAGGTLIARGTETRPIVFSSATPGVRWFGIELHSGHDRDIFAHCRVRDSRMGIICVSTSPVIENCLFEENQQGVTLLRQARPAVRTCKFFGNVVAVVVSMQSTLTLASSEVEGSGEAGVRVDAGSGGVVEKTRLSRNKIGIQKRGPASFRVARSRFDANEVGVSIDREGAVAELRGNVFSNNQRAVVAATKAAPRVTDNTFAANETAIRFDGRSRGSVDHNDLTGNRVGIHLSRTSNPEITSNEFSKNDMALLCETSSYPIIADNNFLGNATAVQAGDYQSFEWTRSIWKSDEWESWARSYGRDRIVARSNYWGEETTREMEAGAMPIGSIVDYHTYRDVLADGKPYRRDEVDFRPFRAVPVPNAGVLAKDPKP